VSYKYNEYPVYGSGLKVIASKEGISSITGKFFSFNQVEKRYYAVSPAESVLLDYLSLYGNKYGNDVEIKEINRGYFIHGEISSVSSYAIPTYQFIFSNGKRIFLDARENIESEYKLLLEN